MPRDMDILQLCPLWFAIAKDAQGGIETLLYQLVEALESQGCRNRLIATADSRTAGALIPAVDSGLFDQMRQGQAWEYGYYEQQILKLALEYGPGADIVHSHIGYPAFALSSVPSLRGRVLHTVHSPVVEDMLWYVGRHPDMWLATVSEFQAGKLRARGATRVRAIHNAIDVDAFTFRPRSEGGLLYIGRMEAVKGPDLAVRVARETGLPLTLAGPMTDRRYFEEAIRPSLGGTIEYVGVVSHARKNELYGQAGCVVLPFRGEEPFGLVAIEAMACGAPVVALANGALPEIVEEGLTGYLVPDGEGLAEAARRALSLDREAVRCRVAERFNIGVAAGRYRDLYREIREEA